MIDPVIYNGMLSDVKIVDSPNFDERPDPEDISLIVIHAISLPPNEYGGDYIDALFTNQLDRHEHPYFEDIAELKVSSHILINRTGEITQYVPFHKRAWHAGESLYNGRSCCNDFAIGIELEGSDNDEFTTAQYETLISLISRLIETYPQITADKIVGHCDIAPGRKTDPGPHFDWARLQLALSNKSARI